MARWIHQVFHLPFDIDLHLKHERVEIWSNFSPDEDSRQRIIMLPVSRDQANQFAIALRQAAKRLEEIGQEIR